LFVKVTHDYELQVGAPQNGLYLNKDLSRGYSKISDTYDNFPLHLIQSSWKDLTVTEQDEEFQCQTLEAYIIST